MQSEKEKKVEILKSCGIIVTICKWYKVLSIKEVKREMGTKLIQKTIALLSYIKTKENEKGKRPCLQQQQ